MWSAIFLAFSTVSTLIFVVESGSAGLCRTECVEQNALKIVRTHLKDDLVMAGLCSNSTDTNSSIVTPYVCHRNVGLWTLDELDDEGVVPFKKPCPTPEQYSLELRATCPRVEENKDEPTTASDELPKTR